MDHATATDWARKEIAGAPIHREYVGENDEEVHLRGAVFPYSFGGLGPLEYMNDQRLRGNIHILMRGDGVYMGWFALEKLVRQHKFIASSGVGKRIDFNAAFVRMPIPSGETYVTQIMRGSK
jgi:phage protein U